MKVYIPMVIALALTTSACSDRRVAMSNENVDLAVEQSHTVIKVGESVTFTAHATGTAGRDEDIKWRTKGGGDLESLNDSERYARVTYKNPGQYAVLISLFVDGKLVDEERAMVQVEPLS